MNKESYKRIMGMDMIRERQAQEERRPIQAFAQPSPETDRSNIVFRSLSAYEAWDDAQKAQK